MRSGAIIFTPFDLISHFRTLILTPLSPRRLVVGLIHMDLCTQSIAGIPRISVSAGVADGLYLIV